MEKGFKTLELIGDLDDKYIYEASKPWKKQHRFFHIQRSWKTAVAGIILLIMVGCTLRYQEDVKAALQRVTSWIGQALGIKNGDTDSYTNVVGKSISRDGITITLNEIVMDSKNLWINQIRYRIFRIGGTQATYQRTKKTIAHLIGKRDSEGDCYHIAQCHFPMKILEQYI